MAKQESRLITMEVIVHSTGDSMGQKVGNKPKTYATEQNLRLQNNERVGNETERVPVTVRRLIEMLAVPLCKTPLAMSPTIWMEPLRNRGKIMAGGYSDLGVYGRVAN